MDRSRLCVRPDCAAPADVTLRYDYEGRNVWLDPLEVAAEPGTWGLCVIHADGLTVPHGWKCEDRRKPGSASSAPPLPV